MKKILSTFLIAMLISNIFITNVIADNDKWYFVVTAYYSPLPNQEYYLTGDYESEKRLNWQGIRWASWKEVFSWMLAAPKIYEFWTKVYLEWLWVWEISDRGWAIVKAGERWYSYDRIDVWVWYWDEWLRRALYWGKRTIKWSVVLDSSNVTLNYNTIASPAWATKWLKQIPNIFSTWIWKWSNSWIVKKLQELLQELWLYKWEIDWVYNNEVIDIVYDFQLKNEIIDKWEYYWAGYWGQSTRALFLKKYLNWEFDKIEEKSQDNVEKSLSEPIISEEDELVVDNEPDLSIFESAADEIEKIKKLQNILTELNLYSWEKTWVYKDIIDTIYDYQLSKWIVTWIYSPWAWNFWPKTRASLKETYKEFLSLEEQKKQEQAKIDEEAKKEALRLEEENKKAEERKIELEKKYKSLEELSLKKAEEKINSIWTPKFWEVSHSVRELQLTLKELWFFEAKDTAIYWPVTKESILAYQIERKLVSVETDLWAWLIWPITLNSIKIDLKQKFLQEMIKTEWINEKELSLLTWVESL